MAYILDPFSINTEGHISPSPPSGDYCLTPFALCSWGIIVLEVVVVDDEPVFNRGGGPDAAMVKRIQMEDHELFLMIVAFLEIRDDC